MTVYLHEGDLPDGLDLGPEVAIDSETMGLRFRRDPLCVVQLSSGDGDAHVVRLGRPDYDCPNLKRLLADPKVLKLFHFGRFDIGMFDLHLGVQTRPVYCTKIASKLARTIARSPSSSGRPRIKDWSILSLWIGNFLR